jgi:hypothetical protein
MILTDPPYAVHEAGVSHVGEYAAVLVGVFLFRETPLHTDYFKKMPTTVCHQLQNVVEEFTHYSAEFFVEIYVLTELFPIICFEQEAHIYHRVDWI